MAMTGGTARLVAQGTPPRWPGPVSLYVYYKESSQSIANNTTVLSLGMYVTTPSGWDIGSWEDWNGSYIGTATSGANCKTFNGDIPNFQGTRWLVENQNFTVTHEKDGSKTVTIYWHWGVNSGWSGVMNNPSGSFSVKLTMIPKASPIRATDANIESTSIITIDAASANFTSTVAYKADGQSDWTTIWTKQKHVSYGWTVPKSLYNLIPNAKKIGISLRCQTYNGSSLVGTEYADITAHADEGKCAPTATVTGEDVNSASIALTGNSWNIIKGISDLRVRTTATAKNGATISSIRAKCGSVEKLGVDVTFIGAESNIVSVTVTDSRGFSANVGIAPGSLINYIIPTITPTISRDTPTGNAVTVSVKGNFFNGLFGTAGAVANTLRVRVRYKTAGSASYGSWADATITKGTNTYSATLRLTGLDYKTAYEFGIILDDAVLSRSVSGIPLSKGVPVFDWGENDFAFNVPVSINGGTLTIGETTITEAQLKSILALIT